MDFIGKGYEFWYHLKISSLMFPYLRHELDRKYNPHSTIRKLKETDPDLAESLKGKVCVMTGGTRGIGAEVVKVLLRKDCYVITASSSKNSTDRQKSYDFIRAEVPEDKGKLEIWHMDLKSMDSVIEFTDKLKETKLSINYLIANAGIMHPHVGNSHDHFEEHFAINYLSHCLLIDRLIDNLYDSSKISGTESRIVLVSSVAHKGAKIRFNDLMLKKSAYSLFYAYGQSKLAMIMFGLKLDRWLKEEGKKSVTVNSLHPGICSTQLLAHMPLTEELRPMASLAIRSSKEGAETTIYAVISSQMNGISGKYLEDCVIEEPSWQSKNVEDQDKLWYNLFDKSTSKINSIGLITRDITWKFLENWTQRKWF